MCVSDSVRAREIGRARDREGDTVLQDERKRVRGDTRYQKISREQVLLGRERVIREGERGRVRWLTPPHSPIITSNFEKRLLLPKGKECGAIRGIENLAIEQITYPYLQLSDR